MKAKLLPLNGKYYGSTIEIDAEKNYPNNIFHIKVWYSGNYEPSDRELASYSVSRSEWNNDKFEVARDDDWGGKSTSPKAYLDICDCHFESQETLDLCNKIISCLNESNVR